MRMCSSESERCGDEVVLVRMDDCPGRGLHWKVKDCCAVLVHNTVAGSGACLGLGMIGLSNNVE